MKRQTRKVLFWGMVLLVIGPAARAQFAQTSYGVLGYSNPSDALSPSARVVGMGSAFVGVADDGSALFDNPAGLGSLQRGEIGLYSDLRWVGAFQETGMIVLPLPHLGGFALAGSYLTYGSLEGRDIFGSLAPNYSADQFAFQAGWGLECIPEVSLGLALRYSQQGIMGSDYSSFSPQIGLLLTPLKDWKFGLDFLYGGWGPADTSMVSTFKGGLSYTWRSNPDFQLLAALGNSYQTDSIDRFQGGVELSFQSRYFLRAGYEAVLQGTGYEGPSMGAGIEIGNLKLDYAYLPYGDLGDTHRFSLSYLFESLKNPTSKIQDVRNPVPQTQKSPSGSKGIDPAHPLSSDAGTGNIPAEGAPPKPDIQASSDKTKDSLTVRFNIPVDLTAQGEALEAENRHSEALGLFRKAVEQDPPNAQAWWDMANIYYKLGQKAYAIQCYEKVISLKPNAKALVDWVEKYKSQTP